MDYLLILAEINRNNFALRRDASKRKEGGRQEDAGKRLISEG